MTTIEVGCFIHQDEIMRYVGVGTGTLDLPPSRITNFYECKRCALNELYKRKIGVDSFKHSEEEIAEEYKKMLKEEYESLQKRMKNVR